MSITYGHVVIDQTGKELSVTDGHVVIDQTGKEVSVTDGHVVMTMPTDWLSSPLLRPHFFSQSVDPPTVI